MNVHTLLAAVRRRWYVVLVGVVGTVLLAAYGVSSTPPEHEAKGSALLLPPPSSWSDGGNPYLALANMGPAADVVVRYLASDKVRLEVAAQLPEVEYVVEPDYGTNGPVIMVTSDAPDATTALAGMQAVLDRIPSALDDLQGGLNVPTKARLGSMPLAVGTTASAIWSGTLRIGMAATAVGLLVTLLLVMLVDSFAMARKARRGAVASPRRRRHPVSPTPDPVTSVGRNDTAENGAERAPTAAGDPHFYEQSARTRRETNVK